MKKCHYVYDKKYGKVLIPGCYGTAFHYPNMNYCTCRDFPETFKEFEKQEYNKILSEKQQYIKELEKEVFRLTRILRKVNGFK